MQPQCDGRSLRGLLVSLALLSACAHTAPPAPGAGAEVARLRAELAERERTIRDLEGRLALREALRTAPREEPIRRESVRIGDDAARREVDEAAARETEPPAPSAEQEASPPSRGPRPLLRLHEGRSELTATWAPLRTSERLKVVPVPSLPDLTPGAEAAAEDLYVRALDLVRRRAFPEALRELDAFLLTFPADARAPRAAFWRGEVLYARREYARALEAFEALLARAPGGERTPDLLLRIARCCLHMGNQERARAALERLSREYPDSEAARLVEQGRQEDS